MATLLTARTRFLHVPKTGGSWVTDALADARVAVQPLDPPTPLHPGTHAGLHRTRAFSDRFTFAFVRHPLAWWRSYWGYRMRTGWSPDHKIDSRACSSDFNTFIELVLRDLSGYLSDRLERYVGPPERPIEFIGRQEHLVDDLVTALWLAGERFDEERLRAHPHVNAGDWETRPALFRHDLAERLAEAERAAIDRFYPGEPLLWEMIQTDPPPG